MDVYPEELYKILTIHKKEEICYQECYCQSVERKKKTATKSVANCCNCTKKSDSSDIHKDTKIKSVRQHAPDEITH